MNAEELFKWEGYMLDEPNEENVITYSKDILDKITFGYIGSEIIAFEDKEICFTNKSSLTLDELKAVNQQVKELRW